MNESFMLHDSRIETGKSEHTVNTPNYAVTHRMSYFLHDGSRAGLHIFIQAVDSPMLL